jgi:hypothetical protein
LEETAEDTNGHLISFKIKEKSLQWVEIVTLLSYCCGVHAVQV